MKKQRKRWKPKSKKKAARQEAAILRSRKHVVVQPIIAEIMVPRHGKPLRASPPMISLAERKAAAIRENIKRIEAEGVQRELLRPLATPLYDNEVIPPNAQIIGVHFFARPTVTGRRSGHTPNLQNIPAPRPPRRR